MKLLVPIVEKDVAPRFDLATEAVISSTSPGRAPGEPRIILLPGASGEDLCKLIIKEEVTTVVCGAIEEIYYQYLCWKKIKVIDGVIGPYLLALQLAASHHLKSGFIVREGSSTCPESRP